MSKIVYVATAVVSLAALGACSVNTAPPAATVAPTPSTTVVTPPAPIATPGSTVVVPRAY